MNKLSLSFCDYPVDVYCLHQNDYRHLLFYYRSHLRLSDEAKLRVLLLADNDDGFIAAMSCPEQVKSVLYDSGQGWTEYETFSRQASKLTLIPPLGHRAFSQQYQAIHGAACELPDQSALVIRGESMAGKSLILLHLISCFSLPFISDDIILLNTKGHIFPFFRPIGVREHSLDYFPQIAAKVKQYSQPITTASGTTYMLPAHYIAPLSTAQVMCVGLEIWVERGEKFKCKAIDINDHSPDGYRPKQIVKLSFDPVKHFDQMCITLEQLLMTYFPLNLKHTAKGSHDGI